jgi:hypothetical protein
MYIKKLTMAISRLFRGREGREPSNEGGRGLFRSRRPDSQNSGGSEMGLGGGGPNPQDPNSLYGYSEPILPSQNPQRYKKTDGGWEISALPDNPTSKQRAEIIPLKINASEILPLKPLLSESVKGIVVYLTSSDEYLCSPTLYSTIKDSYNSNPHLFYLENDTIMGASIGKSIPIIRIDDTNLESLSQTQEDKCKKAGVTKLIWPQDRNRANLLQQIDWTLGDSQKPFDEYSITDLDLKGDYSIVGLQIIPLDGDKKIDEDALKSNLKTINDRLAELRNDLNTIKDIYYNGIVPNGSTEDYRIVSSISSINDETSEPTKQVVFKRTTIQAKEEERTNQSITQAQDEAEKLARDAEENARTLQQKIDEQADQLEKAQTGDRVAQDNLARQLRDAQASINSTRNYAEEQAAKYAKNTK